MIVFVAPCCPSASSLPDTFSGCESQDVVSYATTKKDDMINSKAVKCFEVTFFDVKAIELRELSTWGFSMMVMHKCPAISETTLYFRLVVSRRRLLEGIVPA